jgi:hypothetical protein
MDPGRRVNEDHASSAFAAQCFDLVRFYEIAARTSVPYERSHTSAAIEVHQSGNNRLAFGPRFCERHGFREFRIWNIDSSLHDSNILQIRFRFH